MGQAHFARGESEGPSRGELWPKLDNIEHKTVLGYSRGHFSPRQIQNPTGKKKGKTGIGLNLKENLKYPGTTALIAIQCSAPDRAVFFNCYNHSQPL